MTYLLDTNAWLRLFRSPGEISPDVRRRLNGESTLALSPFSLIEVAQKHAKAPEKIGLGKPIGKWFELALPGSIIRLLPITPAIAAKAYDLGTEFHGDPADRIIAATAITHHMTLVTSDKLLLSYAGLDSLSTR